MSDLVLEHFVEGRPTYLGQPSYLSFRHTSCEGFRDEARNGLAFGKDFGFGLGASLPVDFEGFSEFVHMGSVKYLTPEGKLCKVVYMKSIATQEPTMTIEQAREVAKQARYNAQKTATEVQAALENTFPGKKFTVKAAGLSLYVFYDESLSMLDVDPVIKKTASDHQYFLHLGEPHIVARISNNAGHVADIFAGFTLEEAKPQAERKAKRENVSISLYWEYDRGNPIAKMVP